MGYLASTSSITSSRNTGHEMACSKDHTKRIKLFVTLTEPVLLLYY